MKNITYYHGTSTAAVDEGIYILQPPSETGTIQEEGRTKNLDKVFFTTDIGIANIYAGRAKNRFGGQPVIYRVIPMGDVEVLPGPVSVLMSDWAFVEKILV